MQVLDLPLSFQVVIEFIAGLSQCLPLFIYFRWKYPSVASDIKQHLTTSWSLNKFCIYLIILQTLFFGVSFFLQHQGYISWIFTFSNYLDEDGHLSWRIFWRMIFFIPIQEELFYRGVMFHILFKRVRATKNEVQHFSVKQTQGLQVQNVVKCAFIANCFFGSCHLLNILFGKYSLFYVLLQGFIGFEVGMVFSLLVAQTNTFSNNIVLHIVNNIFASSLSMQNSYENPMFLFLVCSSVFGYTIVLWYLYNTYKIHNQRGKTKNQ